MSLLSSLTNRIFLASALLVAVSIGLAVYRVNQSVTAQAEADLQGGLADAASLVEDFSRTQFADFVSVASLIADLPKLNAAAATEDRPTVGPIAGEYQRKIGTDLFVVLGRTDRVLASAGPLRPDDAAIGEMLAACRRGAGGAAFRPYAGALIHAIAVPLAAGPSSTGTLLAGFTLGREFASRIKAVTNSDIALASGAEIIASTLDARGAADLAAAGPPARSGAFVRHLGDEDYVGRVQRLGPDAALDEPVALVLRSRTERLRFLPALRWQLAVTGLAAMLLSTLIGYGIARTVTRPVRALTATMRDMAATGDLARAVPAGGRWDDEDARVLASTFRQLTTALDRFQREAAQRERLAALGRWSTVVAHEIRNPLMIIKSAARSLRKLMAPDVADLAASIDEEVQRLNGVVTGVLDFARPIRFNLAPEDLGDICRDAARAAQTSAEEIPIAVDCEPAHVPVDTDAERLRSVLVNVLTNAQHAVRAREAPSGPTPPIRLRVRPTVAGRWLVEVIDQGAGITPEDLPRLFEPFFTTRRTGSGLGLALARNIIEGLGGTIAADSRPGAGTTVRIDLPERAVRAEERP
jgi:signal transduction histidine kinase